MHLNLDYDESHLRDLKGIRYNMTNTNQSSGAGLQFFRTSSSKASQIQGAWLGNTPSFQSEFVKPRKAGNLRRSKSKGSNSFKENSYQQASQGDL